MRLTSLTAVTIASLAIILTGLFYYPKWAKTGTEATLSWDVSGYYMYLPATFIYKDIKECKFQQDILSKYTPTYDFQQAFKHSSGNYVMKYPCGMAIMYAPAFALAHGYALIDNQYTADGFSRPYQVAIFLWSLFIAIIGLYFLRKILLEYFDDASTAITILIISIGSNYYNYAAIDSAMTHNYLFTLYALLIYFTIRWHKQYQWSYSILIGVVIGLMALIRPTEIISLIIPFVWGCHLGSNEKIRYRIIQLWKHRIKVFSAIVITACIGMIQLCYWKYVAGEWLVYSYEEQGFSWLHPHIHDGLLSYRSGWLIYSPVMVFGVIGLMWLWKNHRSLFGGVTVFIVLFTYIVTAWDIWWYGGSLGNRAMIQSYPLWAFPIAAFWSQIPNWKSYIRIPIYAFAMFFIYISIWFMHQAHLGGKLHAGKMTKAYFWKTLGTYKVNPLDVKLLDTDEIYERDRNEINLLLKNDFENSEAECINTTNSLEGFKSLCLNAQHQYSPVITIPISNHHNTWIRVAADYYTSEMEWDVWKMCQCQVSLYKNEQLTKTRMIRIQRHLSSDIPNRIWIDIEVPSNRPDSISVQWWNAGSNKTILIDNLLIESYN